MATFLLAKAKTYIEVTNVSYNGKTYQKAKATIEITPEGIAIWEVTMENNADTSGKGKGWTTVSLYLKIGRTEVINDHYNSGSYISFPEGNGTTNSGEFKLSDPNATDVPIELRVCCMQDAYKEGKWSDEGIYDSISETLSRPSYTNGTAPTLTIKDLGTKFSLSGTLGKAGTNNILKESVLYYTTNGEEPDARTDYTEKVDLGTDSGKDFYKEYPIPLGCEKVIAVVYCYFKYNTTHNYKGHLSADVKYYKKPSDPGTPVKIDYNKKRLTIKEPWIFSWGSSKPGNANSPIKGYRLRVLKNGKAIPIKNANGQILTKDNSSTPDDRYKYYYDRTVINQTTGYVSTSMTFYPAINDFKPKDTVEVVVQAYAKNGDGEFLTSGAVSSAVPEPLTVENAATVRIKADGTWKEGQVYIKAGGTWKEADTVYIKANDTWIEAI